MKLQSPDETARTSAPADPDETPESGAIKSLLAQADLGARKDLD